MDFRLSEDHASVRDLAEQIFGDQATVQRISTVERAEGGFDASLWRRLAEADLLGIALPVEHGGAGLGALGLAALLEQQGRRVAPLPVWAVVTTGAMPISRFGTEQQRARWLPRLVAGGILVTGCFDLDHARGLTVTGGGDRDGWTLSGEVVGVTGAPIAAALVVPFDTPEGPRVAVVPTDTEGLSVEDVAVTNHECSGHVRFDGVHVTQDDLLPADGAVVLDHVRTHARTALAALAVGVCQEAVAITAAFTSERVQFGRPLSTNQAVALRAADAYLDTERIRLATYKAAWHLDRGEDEEARVASLVAKWWASVGGLRVVHATQHLHGGIGADVDYPIHRYFLWGRQLAFSLGSAGAVEAELGDLLEHVGPIGAPA